MKKKILIILAIIIVTITGLYLYYKEEEKTDEKEEEIITEQIVKEKKMTEENLFCYVDVKGEVVNPGVYECVNNDKVIDIINKAGGLTNNAETSVINLSKGVTNEMLIIVYSKKQIEEAIKRLNAPTIVEVIKEIEKECICPDNVNEACEFTEDNTESNSVNNNESNKKININNASQEELMTLPSIGESKAKSIIEYRNINKFEKIEDINEVSGIGDSIFNAIKDLIEV